MKIEVTQEDIDLGVPGDNLKCAIARAIGRSVGPCAVGPDAVRIFATGQIIKLPPQVQRWVEDYDSIPLAPVSKKVKPITVEVK